MASTPRSLSAVLVLADGRFPAGGHAHSGGLESVVTSGGVGDIATLAAFLTGRLHDVGRSDAALAAASVTLAGEWAMLDAEAAARCPSPALRATSRSLGRSLVRAARAAWPGPVLDGLHARFPLGAMCPVAWGGAAVAAGVGTVEAATAAALASINGPAAAAVRVLGLDPFAVTAVVAGLAGDVDAIAADVADRELADLPAPGAPLPDLAAEDHARWPTRLFAS